MAPEQFVLKVDVLKAGIMGKLEFDESHVVARPLGQSISNTAALVGCSWSAVVHRRNSNEPGTWLWRRLARVVRSNKQATVTQIPEEGTDQSGCPC